MAKPFFESSYRFKFIKSTWGIYAQIHAEVQPLIDTTYSAEYRISDLVWFTFNGKLTAPREDLSLMLKGLKSVSEEIEKCIDGEIIIALTDFQIIHSDYQKEGMFYAFAGWARNHFDLSQKEFTCYFNKEENKYVFPELE